MRTVGENGRWMWYWNYLLLEVVPEVQEIFMYSSSKYIISYTREEHGLTAFHLGSEKDIWV